MARVAACPRFYASSAVVVIVVVLDLMHLANSMNVSEVSKERESANVARVKERK